MLARRHLYHHGRFYAAIAIGLAVYVVVRLIGGPQPAAAAGDAFFLAYLAACAGLLLRSTTDDLKRRAAQEDEGILLVVAIALGIIAFNVAGIFAALNQQRPGVLSLGLVLAAAPLGWLVLHVISAFHYADLYYFDPSGEGDANRALAFPGRNDPGLWDFVYFSFVIGMTFQVSDVQIRTTAMRRAVLAHSIVSFFFATVLIALTVNAVAGGH